MRRLAAIKPYVADGARIVLFIFLAVAAIIFLAKAIITLSVSFSLDYGEGPLLDQAVRLANGQPLYSPNISEPPYTVTNYPPLFIVAMAPFVKVFGPTLLAGRVISLLATLATAVFLALIVHTFSRDRLAAASTAVIFLAIPYVVQWAGLVRVDMLALALSTAALYLLVRRPTARWSLIVAGLLLVAAVYTRQSYGLAAPLAAFVWLWYQERRQALRLALLVGGLGLLLFIILTLVTRGGFFFHIVTANVNEFNFSGLGRWIGELAGTAPIALALGGLFLVLAPRRPPMWTLLLPYLAGSVLSALTVGKIGANVNYFLELSAALSLVAGSLIVWSRQRPLLQAGLLVLLALQVGLFMQATLEGPVADLSFRRQDTRAVANLAEIVADVEGPVLADEYMALLPLQDRPLYLQPFEVTQLAHAGRWEQAELLESIRNQEFPLILIYQNPGFRYPVHEDRWTPEMLAAIEESYQPAQVMAGNILYQPLGQAGVATTAVPARNPTFAPDDLQVGPPLVISQAPSIYVPDIAANPDNPNHLAAGITTVADVACAPPECQIDVGFYTSTDGGATWSEQVPFSAGQQALDLATVEFGPDSTLYALSLRDGQPLINRAQEEPYEMAATEAMMISISRNPSRPWLTINPENGHLFLAYSGRARNNFGVRLNHSADQGQTWSSSVSVDDGVPLSELNAGRTTAPGDAQALLGQGDNVAVVWRWDTGFWGWPLGVWLATSSDGGENFGERRKIAETWGPINSAFHDGVYYVVYRSGSGAEQQLAVAVSADGGETWRASVASGEISLSYGFDHNPGLGIAPDGTLDVAFYARQGDASECALDRDEWINQFEEGLRDTCIYDIYYTFSEDGGQTFSEPIRLNEAPIRADVAPFRQVQLAVASTDEYAYVSWNATPEASGPQAVTVRIER